jgi:spore coat polysaccharide biosynthesis protein SpsF
MKLLDLQTRKGCPMSTPSSTETPQERFWRGEFGDAYSKRNAAEALVRANYALFADILGSAPGVRSIVELGCNIGNNLQALKRLNPEFRLSGFEINAQAAEQVRSLGIGEIHHRSILEPDLKKIGKFELAFTKCVLIHIVPDQLPMVYKNLYELSNKYILIAEYYNPTPVEVNYRGHSERLFKRDFAGEMMDQFNLELVRYGFSYHRDPYFPMDDVTWFIMRKI